MLDKAVALCPQMSPRIAQRGDQQRGLMHCKGLASTAALVASMAGKGPLHCLQLLELGRGVIQGLVMDNRSDLSVLQMQRPDLADRFDCIRMEVDSPIANDSDGCIYERNRERRMQAIRELDETLTIIRNLPGFEGFQLPPTSKSLIAMAREGPIVTIDCKLGICKAFIVSCTGITSLSLPGVEDIGAQKQISGFRELPYGNRSTYGARNKKMVNFLLWLWDTIVEPVCDALGFGPVGEGGTLPRIWWVGVGSLATAPFHAAGDHSPGSTRNTLSRAISSYISTIRALSFAREVDLKLLHEQDSKLLIVTMPETPGQKSLKATEEASKIVDNVLKASDVVQIEIMECPDSDSVLDELPSCQAVHFACHGVSDTQDPSNSHLLLVKDDGSVSGIIDRLTIERVAAQNMKRTGAQIAYLSACDTAAHKVDSLEDESIHIASGFQLAGFAHVLATLWKSEDLSCQIVAAEFYRLLFDGKLEEHNGHSKVSHSFHHAIMKLRKDTWKQPIKWVSFIHTGA